MNSGPLPRELTPGQAATRSGFSVSALHYYEREGLIRSARTAGNQRRYDRATLRRLGVIRAAQSLGIPLSEIKRRLDSLPHDKAASKADWANVAADWREDLTSRIERLTRLRDYLEGCIGCGCLSTDRCPLYNPDDVQGSAGSGPRLIDEKS
ncbi:redox-sensitive transcriptional activator SoxR [Parvularcula sp. ZS-1/3]|uniref:Redox-sensitive transcriptional activator SoxR n=1 Tax=Parvularcula mediterranea TaxID=2732508 RepID=A0A7Y3RPF4_9PROT|nr:redox-sensitive transcriptional activator SoxR [Parvularcula mediterranea]NNU17385.1 redox-sensitive transcriptional activator SoxR [Parvularcula mediterranea]